MKNVVVFCHSMARAILNKCPTFQTQIYLVKVPLNVNIVKQDLLNEKQFLKILWWK